MPIVRSTEPSRQKTRFRPTPTDFPGVVWPAVLSEWRQGTFAPPSILSALPAQPPHQSPHPTPPIATPHHTNSQGDWIAPRSSHASCMGTSPGPIPASTPKQHATPTTSAVHPTHHLAPHNFISTTNVRRSPTTPHPIISSQPPTFAGHPPPHAP